MNKPNHVSNGHAQPEPPSLHISDVYYVIFRRKWLILLCTLAGLGGAAYIYLSKQTVYYSEAKLLVRYVEDTRAPAGVGANRQVNQPDTRGESIINSEIEILQSADLCELVAVAVGPEKLLAGSDIGEGNSKSAAKTLAGRVILRNLIVEQVRKSPVIRIRFMHSDMEVVQSVVREMIAAYFQKHKQIHRQPGEQDEYLQSQTDIARRKLEETEKELREKMAALNIFSIEDSKKTMTEQLSRVQQEVWSTEFSLAELSTTLKPALPKPAGTNAAAIATAANGIPAVEKEITPEQQAEYNRVSSWLESLRTREFGLRSQFTDQTPMVVRVRGQIKDAEMQKAKMLEEFPKLAAVAVSVPAVTGVPNAGPDVSARIAALQAKLKQQKAQETNILSDMKALIDAEGQILQLKMRRELEEKNYRYFAANHAQANFDNLIAGNKLSNINEVQAPTAAMRDPAKRLKPSLTAAMGGIGAGLALAFLLEFFLDQRLKRPVEVEAKLRLPLFFSIPRLPINKRRRALSGAAKAAIGPGGLPVATTGDPRFPSSSDAVWRPQIEGLRDRTLMHFHGNTHKPKLIGVTACSGGVGVTSIAAGLAAALSETGEGNVLLVDLTLNDGVAHPFYNGKPSCGLTEALETGKRQSGLVSENFYLAKANGAAEPETKILLQRLSVLLPKLKASDFDYIVFDMPVVTRAGASLRLAGMMDLLLLVIESEKEQQDLLRKTSALLGESTVNVRAVLNKVRTYVPRWLHQDL